MSYSQSTTHYNWPLPQETDLFNGLDDNAMKEELDEKVYTLEQTSQDDHAAVIELSGRVQEVEQTVAGYDQTIEGIEGTLSEHAERLILLTNRQTELSRQLKTKASESTIAPEYNEEESYSIGDLVYHSNILYEANAAIVAPAGNFDPTKWDIATIASKLGGGSGVIAAVDVTFDDVLAQLGASNVQGAIVALKTLIDSIGGGAMPALNYTTPLAILTGSAGTYTAVKTCYMLGSIHGNGGDGTITINNTEVARCPSADWLPVQMLRLEAGDAVSVNTVTANSTVLILEEIAA